MTEKQEKKIYKASPLPFQGQKRNFVEQFKKVLIEFNNEFQIQTIVDLLY